MDHSMDRTMDASIGSYDESLDGASDESFDRLFDGTFCGSFDGTFDGTLDLRPAQLAPTALVPNPCWQPAIKHKSFHMIERSMQHTNAACKRSHSTMPVR